MIEEITGSAKELEGVAVKMGKADKEARMIMEELSMSNDQVMDAVREIGKSVAVTSESAVRIQEALDIITPIASETGLIALNASIEAARAGEAGRGFAIVASRISRLSEDTSQSAYTIGDIVRQLSGDARAAVLVMAEAEKCFMEQQNKIMEAEEKFKDISKGIEISGMETERIYRQTGECNSATIKIMDVIGNLSAISQENVAAVQETTASIQELNASVHLVADLSKGLKEAAEELGVSISFFKIGN